MKRLVEESKRISTGFRAPELWLGDVVDRRTSGVVKTRKRDSTLPVWGGKRDEREGEREREREGEGGVNWGGRIMEGQGGGWDG